MVDSLHLPLFPLNDKKEEKLKAVVETLLPCKLQFTLRLEHYYTKLCPIYVLILKKVMNIHNELLHFAFPSP